MDLQAHCVWLSRVPPRFTATLRSSPWQFSHHSRSDFVSGLRPSCAKAASVRTVSEVSPGEHLAWLFVPRYVFGTSVLKESFTTPDATASCAHNNLV